MIKEFMLHWRAASPMGKLAIAGIPALFLIVSLTHHHGHHDINTTDSTNTSDHAQHHDGS